MRLHRKSSFLYHVLLGVVVKMQRKYVFPVTNLCVCEMKEIITKNRRKIPHPSRPEARDFVVAASLAFPILNIKVQYTRETNTGERREKSAHGCYAQHGLCCVGTAFVGVVGKYGKILFGRLLSVNPFSSLSSALVGCLHPSALAHTVKSFSSSTAADSKNFHPYLPYASLIFTRDDSYFHPLSRQWKMCVCSQTL